MIISPCSQWLADYRTTKRRWNVCTSTEQRWNRKLVSLASPETWAILSRTDWHKLTDWRAENAQSLHHNSKTWRPSMSAYLELFLAGNGELCRCPGLTGRLHWRKTRLADELLWRPNKGTCRSAVWSSSTSSSSSWSSSSLLRPRR